MVLTLQEKRHQQETLVPMGIDLLDLGFRIKREFGVELDLLPLFQKPDGTFYRTPPDITAGELMDAVIEATASTTSSSPTDVWPRLQCAIADCLGLKPDQVKRDSLLARDLGME